MLTILEKRVVYPIRDIWTNVAKSKKIHLKNFNGDYFLPDSQKGSFPLLANLSIHLAYPYGLGIEIAKDNMVAFEGSNDDISLAYFGREVKEYSNFIREQGLIYIGGRRIYIILNENGQGTIEVEDKLIKEARQKFSEDSFGSSFDKNPAGNYGFIQRPETNYALPGIRDFINHLASK